MLPEWIHWLIAVLPSLSGAGVGLFLPRDKSRFLLGWIGAVAGFGLGFFVDCIVEPPLVFDPAIAVVTIPIGSALWGTLFYLPVLLLWVFMRHRAKT